MASLRRKGATDLPMVAKWVDDAADSPSVSLLDGNHFTRASRHCFRKHRIRVWHRQDHTDRTPAERLRAEVPVLG